MRGVMLVWYKEQDYLEKRKAFSPFLLLFKMKTENVLKGEMPYSNFALRVHPTIMRALSSTKVVLS